MKLSKISKGDIHIETDKGSVRVLGEGMAFLSGSEFSEYLVYSNSFTLNSSDEEIDEGFKLELLKFLESELFVRKMKLIVE